MGNLRQSLEPLRSAGKAGLIVYLMAGDPDLPTTKELLLRLEDVGVAAVELGVPFSDPIADGPVIQRAAERALASGTTLTRVLDLVAEVRQRSRLPVVLFTYVNPVLRVGLERFPSLAVEAGVDGALLLDLPPEEAETYVQACRASGLETVFLVAPTSTDGRVERATSLSTGFVYCVSRTGVTGERDRLSQEVRSLVARVRNVSDLPVAVGFGIARPEHVREVASFADAVVVGSAVVRRVEEGGTRDAVRRVVGLVEDLMQGLARG